MDYKSLKKLETPPPSAQSKPKGDEELVLVLVKLRKGAARPAYISPRSEITEQLFSAEIRAGDLARLDADPAVESVSISRQLPLIK